MGVRLGRVQVWKAHTVDKPLATPPYAHEALVTLPISIITRTCQAPVCYRTFAPAVGPLARMFA